MRPIGAGAITSAAGPFINHLGSTGSLVANTVVGGLAAVAGGGKFENGAITGAFGYLFNSQFHSRTAVPFTDEQNNPILDRDGNRIMRPSDVPPSFFVDAGLAAAAADAGSADAPGMTSRALLLNSVRAQLGMSSESARIRSPLRRLSITQRSGSASMARQQEFLLAKVLLTRIGMQVGFLDLIPTRSTTQFTPTCLRPMSSTRIQAIGSISPAS